MKATDKVAKLVIRSNSGAEYEIPLQGNRVRIGRNKESEIILDDEFASRNHAVIERRGARFYLCDGGSTNGTFVGDEHVDGEQQLKDGDEIKVGETIILFREESTGHSATRPLLAPTREQLTSPIQVDTLAWEVWVDGKRLPHRLSVLEFKLLGYLYGRANAVCSREEIGRELWGDDAYTNEMLHQLVHRLKRRIEPDPSHPRYIVSVPGVGYRLSCAGDSQHPGVQM